MDLKLLLFMLTVNITTLLLVFQKALSVDSQFEACEPYNCGKGPDITYPFWIQGKQNSFCGYPGFQLSCINNEPVLNMSGNGYVIREIYHQNQSVLVTQASLQDNACPSHIRNLTLDRFPFKFTPAHVNAFFFFNCTNPLPKEYEGYSLNCTTGNVIHRSLAVLRYDPMWNEVSGICNASVIIPMDKTENQNLDTPPYRNMSIQDLRKGFRLQWSASSCSVCDTSGGRCGFDYENYRFTCFCSDRPHFKKCRRVRSNLSKKIVILIGVVATVGVVGIVVFIGFFLRRKTEISLVIRGREKMKNKNVEAFLKESGLLELNRYNYRDVKKMTDSFKHKIGQGGYGSVFKGKLIEGKMVAVKVLTETKGDGMEFINEVASISRTSHVNIVTLLGFCIEGKKRALIYEFMANGSLEKFIYNKLTLEPHFHFGWEMLSEIAIGIARGLEYLHRGCNTRILHFDIKPHNILLDEEFSPKIADFGLSKLCHVKESLISMTGGARGTPGYIAPELFSRNFGGVSHKADVYSYGMMVLEMVGGRKNIDVEVANTCEIYFPHWIYNRLALNEDLGLRGVTSVEDQETARKMILVGLWCIQIDPHNRPPMSTVLDMLGGSLEELQVPPKPFLASPSREEGSSFHISTLYFA